MLQLPEQHSHTAHLLSLISHRMLMANWEAKVGFWKLFLFSHSREGSRFRVWYHCWLCSHTHTFSSGCLCIPEVWLSITPPMGCLLAKLYVTQTSGRSNSSRTHGDRISVFHCPPSRSSAVSSKNNLPFIKPPFSK